MAVLAVVDEDALPFLLQPLRRHEPRVLGLQPARKQLRELVRLVEGRAARDRDQDVNAVGAARLHERRELELLERLADQVSDPDGLREAVACVRRVEIEEEEVRPVRLVATPVPTIYL